MRLAWSDADERFRSELRAFLDAHCPAEARDGFDLVTRSGDGEIILPWLKAWQATLFDHGWLIPGYPPELGGRDATPAQTLIYLEEMAARRIPRATHFPGYAIVAPTLLAYGNDEQKALAPAAIRGDTIWCIGMSEPDAGSDLAGLQTRARLDGDEFVVNGQKVWTSYAMVASKCFCYVRTDPDAPKHKGISALIVDLDTPGIDVRPLTHITGQAEFAEVFFTDAHVPATNLVGPLHGGWPLTQGSLAHERAGLWVEGVARLEQTVQSLVALARRVGKAEDPVTRRKIAAVAETASSLRALGYKGFASFAQGQAAPEHSYMKLASSEATKDAFGLGMEILDAFGAVTDPAFDDEAGRWVTNWYVQFANTIAGGTSEIQRNIIAQRILGLPEELTMDFTLSEEQVLLRETAARLLADHCPPALLRAHMDDRDAQASLWAHLSGFTEVGTGPCCDLVVFLDELGYAAAPGPFVASAVLAAPLLGDAALDRVASVAIAAESGTLTPHASTTKWFVPEADLADVIVVVDAGPSARVVERGDCALEPITTVDPTRRVFRVTVPSGGTRLALDAGALAAWQDRMYTAVAADTVGTTRRLFTMALDYAKVRVQFDKPIGSFQAMQHKLADMSLALERATAAVHYAAMTVDAGAADRTRAAHSAKAAADAAAERTIKDSIQIHGGIGYTWEHDLHLYLRRATLARTQFGTSGWHLDRLADLLFA